jgi:hypothetical protein
VSIGDDGCPRAAGDQNGRRDREPVAPQNRCSRRCPERSRSRYRSSRRIAAPSEGHDRPNVA